MSNPFEHSDCDRMGLLISAQLDGELTEAERPKFEAHLEQCSTCRNRMKSFEQLNHWVEIDQAIEATSCLEMPAGEWGGFAEFTKADFQVEKKPMKSDGTSLKRIATRLIPMAAAASVILGLGIAALPTGKTVTAEEIAAPLAELDLIQERQAEGQAQLLATMQFELRILRLELAAMASEEKSKTDSSSDQQRIEEKLDLLLEKVNELSAVGSSGY